MQIENGLSEPLVKLSKVAAIVEKITGERPHVCTIHRWCRRGCKGVKLRTAFAGGHRRSTETWVKEFFQAVTAAADGTVHETAKSNVAARATDHAANALAKRLAT
jgi:hypothetical protein